MAQGGEATEGLDELLAKVPIATSFSGKSYSWLSNLEVAGILLSFDNHEKWLSTSVPPKPASGSLFLYKKKFVKFRRDGYEWAKRTDNRTAREDHTKLKVFGNYEIYGCYARLESKSTFHRRCYWLLKNKELVLVHYLDEDTSVASPDMFPRAPFAVADAAIFTSTPTTVATTFTNMDAMSLSGTEATEAFPSGWENQQQQQQPTFPDKEMKVPQDLLDVLGMDIVDPSSNGPNFLMFEQQPPNGTKREPQDNTLADFGMIMAGQQHQQQQQKQQQQQQQQLHHQQQQFLLQQQLQHALQQQQQAQQFIQRQQQQLQEYNQRLQQRQAQVQQLEMRCQSLETQNAELLTRNKTLELQATQSNDVILQSGRLEAKNQQLLQQCKQYEHILLALRAQVQAQAEDHQQHQQEDSNTEGQDGQTTDDVNMMNGSVLQNIKWEDFLSEEARAKFANLSLDEQVPDASGSPLDYKVARSIQLAFKQAYHKKKEESAAALIQRSYRKYKHARRRPALDENKAATTIQKFLRKVSERRKRKRRLDQNRAEGNSSTQEQAARIIVKFLRKCSDRKKKTKPKPKSRVARSRKDLTRSGSSSTSLKGALSRSQSTVHVV